MKLTRNNSQAVTDLPCNAFAPELIPAYPSAKVILATADSEDAFYKSWMSTIWPLTLIRFNPHPSLLDKLYNLVLPEFPFNKGMRRLVPAIGMDTFPETGRQYYREHCDLVRRSVPKERLLEYNVKQGWEPLCKFLGKEIPDEPFPHVNEKAEFLRNMRKFKRIINIIFVVQLVKFAGVAAVVAGGAWLAMRWQWRGPSPN